MGKHIHIHVGDKKFKDGVNTPQARMYVNGIKQDLEAGLRLLEHGDTSQAKVLFETAAKMTLQLANRT